MNARKAGWRRDPPSVAEVKEVKWWWYKHDGSHQLFELNVSGDGLIVVSYNDGAECLVPSRWPGEWSPCVPYMAGQLEEATAEIFRLRSDLVHATGKIDEMQAGSELLKRDLARLQSEIESAEADLLQRADAATNSAILKFRGDASDENKTALVNEAYDVARRVSAATAGPIGGFRLSDADLITLCCGYEFLAAELRLAGLVIDGDREKLKELQQRWIKTDNERRELVVALRNVNPERAERAIQDAADQARDAERATCAADLASLRATVSNQSSEIAELRAAKRKLRDALERTKSKR